MTPKPRFFRNPDCFQRTAVIPPAIEGHRFLGSRHARRARRAPAACGGLRARGVQRFPCGGIAGRHAAGYEGLFPRGAGRRRQHHTAAAAAAERRGGEG
eukprot:gene19861-biopygen4043